MIPKYFFIEYSWDLENRNIVHWSHNTQNNVGHIYKKSIHVFKTAEFKYLYIILRHQIFDQPVLDFGFQTAGNKARNNVMALFCNIAFSTLLLMNYALYFHSFVVIEKHVYF